MTLSQDFIIIDHLKLRELYTLILFQLEEHWDEFKRVMNTHEQMVANAFKIKRKEYDDKHSIELHREKIRVRLVELEEQHNQRWAQWSKEMNAWRSAGFWNRFWTNSPTPPCQCAELTKIKEEYEQACRPDFRIEPKEDFLYYTERNPFEDMLAYKLECERLLKIANWASAPYAVHREQLDKLLYWESGNGLIKLVSMIDAYKAKIEIGMENPESLLQSYQNPYYLLR